LLNSGINKTNNGAKQLNNTRRQLKHTVQHNCRWLKEENWVNGSLEKSHQIQEGEGFKRVLSSLVLRAFRNCLKMGKREMFSFIVVVWCHATVQCQLG